MPCVVRQLPGVRVVAQSHAAGTIHAHSVAQPLLALVVAGRCVTEIGRRRLDASCGGGWTEPALEKRVNHVLSSGTKLVVIMPDATKGHSPLASVAPMLDRIDFFTNPALALEARRAFAEIEHRDSAAPLALLGHIYALLAIAARTHAAHERGAQPRWLRRVRDYLHDEFRRPLTLDEVSAVAGVSSAHLAREFRAREGSTVANYVRRLRVLWAAEQLSVNGMSLADVALEAGFFDQSHFTRTFRKHLGMTPAEYRRRMGPVKSGQKILASVGTAVQPPGRLARTL